MSSSSPLMAPSTMASSPVVVGGGGNLKHSNGATESESESESDRNRNLLFFDTFSHEAMEELNLDLVQFPSPVLVSEVRVIPLGAPVHANFPGGVRLGATNPTQFQLEFFVNDLGRPGAATFERLGVLPYDQNARIHLHADRAIPTDGLVLRGMYNAITIAVYGTLSKDTAEQLAQQANDAQQRQQQLQREQEIIREREVQEQREREVREQRLILDQQNQALLSPGKNLDRPPSQAQNSSPSSERDRAWHGNQPSPTPSNNSSTHWAQHGRGAAAVNGINSHRHGSRSPPPRGSSPSAARYASRSPQQRFSLEREQQPTAEDKKDELMDDISDISDGDIPEMEDVDPAPPPVVVEPPAPVVVEEEIIDTSVPPPPIREQLSVPAAATAEVSGELSLSRRGSSADRRLSQSQSGSPSEKMLATAEDMEEISDDEAEWSDGDPGGFGTAKPEDADFDFGDDWEDPIRPLDIMAVELGAADELNVEQLVTVDQAMLAQLEQLLERLDKSNEMSVDWIETLESATQTLSDIKTLPSTAAMELREQLVNVSERCLDHDEALSHAAPTAKVRHIKQGLRFVKKVFRTSKVTAEALLKAGLQFVLVSFLQKSHIAPTICLNALQLLDLTLDSKLGFDLIAGRVNFDKMQRTQNVKAFSFLLKSSSDRTLYPELCRFAKKLGPCTKPSVCALLAKFSFCAGVRRLEEDVQSLESEEGDVVEAFGERALTQVSGLLKAFQEARSVLAQPTKLLPIRFRFQPSEDLRIDPYDGLFDILEEHNFLVLLLALTTAPAGNSNLSNACCRFLQEIFSHHRGLKLMWTQSKPTNSLVRYLLQTSSDDHGDEDDASHHQHSDSEGLALHIAYGVHCFELLLKIKQLISEDKYSKTAVVEQLQTLYSMTLTAAGKRSVAEVLAEPTNLEMLTQLIRDSLETPEEEENVTIRPAMRGYACDLVKLVLRTCEDVYRLRGLAATISRLSQEEEVAKMAAAVAWTQPIVDFPSFSCADLPGLCELVKKNKENVSPLMLELITTVRMLAHFLDDRHDLEHAQHKKYALISMYSQDLMQHYLEILESLCGYHAQPALHTATFVGNSGFLLLSIVKPMVRTIKCMLQNVAVDRGTEFKDGSAVTALLRVYNLASVVPVSSLCHPLSREIRADVVLALTAFTKAKFDISSASGSSVWTMMLKELLVFTCQSPHMYLSGLQVLTQLLPLPLPLSVINEDDCVSKEEVEQTVNTRKLWSSHLFPLEDQLQTMIVQFMGIADLNLSHALRRVVVQLSDLSPLISKMVCGAMFTSLAQALHTELPSGGEELNTSSASQAGHPTQDNEPEKQLLNRAADRVLSFAAWALESGSVKTTALRLLLDRDSFKTVFNELCTDLERTEDHTRRELMAAVLQTLCDPDITLISPKPVQNLDQLAQSLPSKESLELVAAAVVEQVFNLKVLDAASLAPSVRTLNLLLEHDVGFSLVQACLEKTPRKLGDLVEKMASLSDGPQFLGVVHCMLDMLNLLLNVPQDVDSLYPKSRTLTLTSAQVKKLMGAEKVDEEAWKLVKDRVDKSELDLQHDVHVSKDQIMQQLEELEAKHARCLDMEVEADKTENEASLLLPAMLPLLDLYSQRQVFSVEPHGPTSEKLTLSVWASDPDQMELEDLSSHATAGEVDLLGVAALSLPAEFDLGLEVRQECDEKSLETDKQLKKMAKKKSAMERKALHNKSVISNYKAGVAMAGIRGARSFARSGHQRPDGFRSRPPNTSRPPSLHVDDFLVLQQRGQQPTGPTGYNKQSIKAANELFAQREMQQHHHLQTGKPSMVGYREATKEPVYDNPMRSQGGPMPMGGPRGHPRGRGGMGAPGGPRDLPMHKSGNGPMYRGGGRGRGGNRGWAPNPGDGDRRFGPPRRGGPAQHGWMHGGERRGGPPGMRGDRRRFGGGGIGGGGGGRDDRPRHMRTMTR